MVFVPSRGFLFFYQKNVITVCLWTCFRPLTGISLFLWNRIAETVRNDRFSSPHGDFSFSIMANYTIQESRRNVFVPSRGFLFFYNGTKALKYDVTNALFSSPHGDFSFSIEKQLANLKDNEDSFRPLTGISLFLWSRKTWKNRIRIVFVPSRGFLFFYKNIWRDWQAGQYRFRPLTGISLFLSNCLIPRESIFPVFVPSRGFLFFYPTVWYRERVYFLFSSPHGDFSFSMEEIQKVVSEKGCFRPLTGISLFL